MKKMMDPKQCLFVLFFVYSIAYGKPANGNATSCKIREEVKCGERPCPCTRYLTFNPKSWYNLFMSAVGHPVKDCKCNILCSKEKEIKCVHGTCQGEFKGCKCQPCWRGVMCDKYVNKNPPKFTVDNIRIQLDESHVIGQKLIHLTTTDEDSKFCQDGEPCECSKRKFRILGGNDGTFKVNQDTGHLMLVRQMTKLKATLTISVQNTKEMENTDRKKSVIKVVILNNKGVTLNSDHHRFRRSVSGEPHALVLTIKPALTTKYYFDIGDVIYFNVLLTTNSSVTGKNSAATQINLNSTFLTLAYVSKTDPNNLESGNTAISNGIRIFLTSVASGQHYSANVSGTVKNTIGPLSNLYITGYVETTVNGKVGYINGKKSSPIIYSVFPTVNLTRDVGAGINVYQNATFKMNMKFPKLDYFLAAELTTNIEDFVFMHLKDVSVTNKGSSVTFNGTASPVYHSSQNNAVKDRVVVDFGYLRCSSTTNNALDINFQVEIQDSPKLFNGTKHWMGVGLQAGYRVLWVEQQAFTVTKNEPALSLMLSSSNASALTRFYIGDTILIQYQVNHTNASLAAAKDLQIKCTLTNLDPNDNLKTDGKGNFDVTEGGNVLLSPPALGTSKIGVFSVTVKNTVKPLEELDVKCNMTYRNMGNKEKRPVEGTMATKLLAGTPSILLSLLNRTDSKVRVGEIREFSLKILLTKLTSPLKIELIMPRGSDNQSIFSITEVQKAVVGKNIAGVNRSAVPVFTPGKVYAQDHAIAVYDLGVGSNPTGNTNSPDNMVEVKFKIVVNDNKDVKNGTKFWVGAGVVGKPRMIWVGQIALSPYFTANPKSRLEMKSTVTKVAESGFMYHTSFRHSNLSEKWAFDVQVRCFLPPYIKFVKITQEDKKFTQSLEDGNVLLKATEPLMFNGVANFTFETTVVDAKLPHDGRVNVLVPVYLTFKDRTSNPYTVVKATYSYFTRPITPPKPVVNTGVIPAPQYYKKGFFIHQIASKHIIYVCIPQRFETPDSACFRSEDSGTNWEDVDNRVASIVGDDAKNNLYGIARNTQAFMKYDNLVKDWVSVDKIEQSGTGTVHSADNVNSNLPTEQKVISQGSWGASKDGLYFKPKGGSWSLKAKWL